VIAALVQRPPYYLADSTNSVQAENEDDLYFLLALLNSELWQWRFRLTSTNNNVQTGELESMPVPTFVRASPPLLETKEKVIVIARNIVDHLVRRATARGHEAEFHEREAHRLESELNSLVYKLYGLSASDRALIARTSRVSGAADD